VTDLWRAAAELAQQGRPGALATVARTRGSTPVPAGAKMLVGPDGRIAGSIGGGCMEAEVIAAAVDAQGQRRPVLLTHHLNADLAGDLGLSCGGTVDVFVEPLVADPPYVAALHAAAAAGAGLVRTATDWSHGARKTFEPTTARRTAVAANLTRDGRYMVERLVARARVLVFGAGHVGAAVARAAAAAGFQVAIVDDRPEFADPGRFPEGIAVLAASPADALARVRLGPADAVVIATRGHRHDAEILALVADSPAGYVGMLGSKRKKIVVTKGLSRSGVPRNALARVHVPIGLPIGAITPEEIAVSVVAELIQWRREPS
jgi:xanthine dehydrogenase accessory factor